MAYYIPFHTNISWKINQNLSNICKLKFDIIMIISIYGLLTVLCRIQRRGERSDLTEVK